MKLQGFAALTLVLVAVIFFAPDASGSASREPARCLLFPYFNTAQGNLAVISITNWSNETVLVRLVWIDEVNCSPEDQWITLTGKDTYTFLDQAVNPPGERGFLYAYVVESMGSGSSDYNCLVGQELVFSVWNFPDALMQYGINAVGFQALQVVPDEKLHLDGVEYTAAPKTVIFPRFFGQMNGFNSQVILINLTGGQHFTAQADVLIYNDNEIAWSSSVTFPCFWYNDLTALSFATTETFLLSSMHDPLELWDGNPDPTQPHKKTGWIEITGKHAYNLSYFIDKASIYAVLIEMVGPIYAASLPWQVADPANYNKAMLWSTNPNGS